MNVDDPIWSEHGPGEAANANATRVLRSLVAVRTRAGGGAGTAWARDLVVTNHHVAPGDRAVILTHENVEHEGSVIARDPEHDLALVHVEGASLDPVSAGESTSLRPGHIVFSAGNPWGRRGVVTAGIVVSTGAATVENGIPLDRAIRADVRLAPGNSGGPMFDAAGQVVGINSMTSGGMAIAVPVEDVLRLIADRDEEPGVLGVFARPVPLPSAIAASYPLAGEAALMLFDIDEGSPAEAAGLLPGDLIVGVDGELGPVLVVGRQLERLRRGRPSTLTLLRGGSLVEATVLPAVRA